MNTSAAQWFTGLGAGFVIAGGLMAAITGPLELDHGSWLAAYLVLVCGVAQYAIGVATVRFPHFARRIRPAQVFGWNIANGLVILGTLIATPYLVDLGGLLLFSVIAILLYAVMVDRPQTHRSHWLQPALIVLLAALAISIPIGLGMAHLRA